MAVWTAARLARDGVPSDALDFDRHRDAMLVPGALLIVWKQVRTTDAMAVMDIGIELDNHDEADRIFAAVSEGANVEYSFQEVSDGNYFGTPVDTFGMQWLISCSGPS